MQVIKVKYLQNDVWSNCSHFLCSRRLQIFLCIGTLILHIISHSTCWLQSFYINRLTLDFGYGQYILCRCKKVGFKCFIFYFCRYNYFWFYQYIVCLKALFGNPHHQLKPILMTFPGGVPLCMNVPGSINEVPLRGCWDIEGLKSLSEHVLVSSDPSRRRFCSLLQSSYYTHPYPRS